MGPGQSNNSMWARLIPRQKEKLWRLHNFGTRSKSPLEQISVALSQNGVVAWLVPATAGVKAQSSDNRGGRDEPGHAPRERLEFP
jgi:hypothetical protein